MHLLDPETERLFLENPKWIIGFSDVSAFHAMAQSNGYCSLHSSMAKHLTLYPEDEVSQAIYRTLTTGEQQPIEYPTAPGSIPGEAEGILVGGNFAVLNGLAGTRYDVLTGRVRGRETPSDKPLSGLTATRKAEEKKIGNILFLEDIAEPIYKVERLLYQLHLSGALSRFCGLIFGQFTEYRADRNYTRMEDMILERLREWGYTNPVALNFPAGHVDDNRPLLLGTPIRLTITPTITRLL